MRIEEVLERSARSFTNKAALAYDRQKWTYAFLDQQAKWLAEVLLKAGMQPSDRLAIHLENSPGCVLSIFAILKLGGTFVVIHPNVKAQRLAFLLNHCRAAALVTSSKGLHSISRVLSGLPQLKKVFIQEGGSHTGFADANVASLQRLPEERSPATRPWQSQSLDDDGPAAFIYTSGSTGHPKAAMLSHRNLAWATESIVSYVGNRPEDVILSVLPLSHSYGLTQLFTAFSAGATLVLQNSFRNPHDVLEAMAQERITGFALAPAMAASLLEADPRKYDLASLRYVTNAAAALPLAVVRKLRGELPHTRLFCMYGQTECVRASYLAPEQIDMRPTSVGKGLPGEEIYLVDEVGNRLGPGTVGELVVCGPNVMLGYWEMPAETANALRPGIAPGERALYTGDQFRMDEEGYFYFVRRRDDVIKSGGEKISPGAIEEVLHALDGVAEAAVVGVPDSILGQAIKAVVRLKEGAQVTQRDLIRHCSRHLETYMVPAIVEFRDALPKTASGKVLKSELLQQSRTERLEPEIPDREPR